MDTTALRARARVEVDELGSEPSDAHDRALWVEERRGAAVLLAALADWNGQACRTAALELGELTDAAVVRLLLDAAQECDRR